MNRMLLIRLALVLAALFFCGVLAARIKSRSLPAPPTTGFEEYEAVPAEMIGWEEKTPIALPDGHARAVAAAPDGLLAVAIDDRIVMLRAGAGVSEIQVGQDVMSLAIASNGPIVAGFRQSAAVYDRQGRPIGAIASLGAKAQVSSVAVKDDVVYIADFGQRRVWKTDFDGAILGHYPGPTPSGFVIRGAYFDVAADEEGVWVVNPGSHEMIRLDDNLTERVRWRRAGLALDAFMGCCNPSHIALLPDGSLVTSEKGIPRIKLYTRDGNLINVVAPPAAFPGSRGPFDLAADSAGRLLALDSRRQLLRVFEHVRPHGPVSNGGSNHAL